MSNLEPCPCVKQDGAVCGAEPKQNINGFWFCPACRQLIVLGTRFDDWNKMVRGMREKANEDLAGDLQVIRSENDHNLDWLKHFRERAEAAEAKLADVRKLCQNKDYTAVYDIQGDILTIIGEVQA